MIGLHGVGTIGTMGLVLPQVGFGPPGGTPPIGGAPALDFNLASNSQYLALISVGGM